MVVFMDPLGKGYRKELLCRSEHADGKAFRSLFSELKEFSHREV